ncbi:MAG: hypothetical protein O2923_14775, partial [Verrucomicrobia bacterium]|nr:hypothetical protein [Verrucomicrobiota bacterium]
CARLSPVPVGCAGEPVTWICRGPSLEKLRQDRALARVSAHRHYPLTGNGVVTMRGGADGWRS